MFDARYILQTLSLKPHLFTVSLITLSVSFLPSPKSKPMAAFTNFLSKRPPSAQNNLIPKLNPLNFQSSSPLFLFPSPKQSNPKLIKTSRINFVPKATSTSLGSKEAKSEERVKRINNIQEFDEALISAKDRLVVVEYANSKGYESNKIYPFMVKLSKSCNDVVFLLVIGDETEETQAICQREKVENVPHFTFYKSMEKVHEEEAVGPDQLVGDVLYYGDSHSEVVQLHSGEDVETLIEDHKVDHKLIVLDVGLKHCGPCVKVYPTVIKLSRQMADTVVFARMNGDENESCMQFLRDMNVIQVPTFLFIRDGKICGRYVGSGKGELIGEILRYQGVRVTY